MKIEKKKIIIIITVVTLVFIILLIGYIGYNKFLIHNNDTKTEKTQTNINKNIQDEADNEIIENDNETFDFDELANTLHSSIQNDNMAALISSCTNLKTKEGEPPATEEKITEISSTSIDKIIEKLKSAKSIDMNITYSWFSCPPRSISYYVSVNSNKKEEIIDKRVFSLYYANDNNILLVAYNEQGFAFHFNSSEEIDNFIESLK